MKGAVFVTWLLFVVGTVIAVLLLFNFYPPAGNSWWTVAGVALIAVIAWRTARYVGRAG